MVYAEESNLGRRVVRFDALDLQNAIDKITEAGSEYRRVYNDLVGYFDNDLKNDVQGDTLPEFQNLFDKKRAQLNAVNDFIDDLLRAIRDKTNQGSDLADQLNSGLRAA